MPQLKSSSMEVTGVVVVIKGNNGRMNEIE